MVGGAWPAIAYAFEVEGVDFGCGLVVGWVAGCEGWAWVEGGGGISFRWEVEELVYDCAADEATASDNEDGPQGFWFGGL